MAKGSNSPGYSNVNTDGQPRNIEGALWMFLSSIGFTIFIVLAKLLSEHAHPVFLAFVRAFSALLLTLPFIMSGRIKLSTEKMGLLVARSTIGSAGFVLSLIAVWHVFELPLAEFNALSFTRPLFVTIFAAIFLNEIVGLMRWSAVLVGFLGILIMAVPGYILFWLPSDVNPTLNLGTVIALLSALTMAAAIVLVKNLSRYHSPMGLLTWSNVLTSAILFIPVLFFWSWPTAEVWGLLLLMSLAAFIAQFCYIKAMSIGDASFLSPMDYLRLPMAVAADWWLIKTFPSIYTWIGAAVIISATLFITIRERIKAVKRPHRETPT